MNDDTFAIICFTLGMLIIFYIVFKEVRADDKGVRKAVVKNDTTRWRKKVITI